MWPSSTTLRSAVRRKSLKPVFEKLVPQTFSHFLCFESCDIKTVAISCDLLKNAITFPHISAQASVVYVLDFRVVMLLWTHLCWHNVMLLVMKGAHFNQSIESSHWPHQVGSRGCRPQRLWCECGEEGKTMAPKQEVFPGGGHWHVCPSSSFLTDVVSLSVETVQLYHRKTDKPTKSFNFW